MPSSGTSLTERLAITLLALVVAGGCAAETRPTTASEFPYLYYAHNYTDARQVIRPLAADRKSKDVVLDNLRLGMASLAWGDLDEAERALVNAHEYLVSGGVNRRDRTVAATVLYEGVRVWTGEPYEQAMAHYYLAALAMVEGDFENARAAIRNALFALRDFKHADDPKDFEVIESQFALGYLLLGAAHRLTGDLADAERPLQRVRKLRPDLKALVQTIAANEYDTLLLVDAGRGPHKVATGMNDALVKFEPDGRGLPTPAVTVSVDGAEPAVEEGPPLVDLWKLSQHPRWWSLQTARRSKSLIGRGLTNAGLVALLAGADEGSEKAMAAGAGAIVAGLFLQGVSEADTRHLAVLPRCVFVVPLELGSGRHHVNVRFKGVAKSNATWHDLRGGEPGDPRVYYLRCHDRNYVGMDQWSDEPLYETERSARIPGVRPYILGGRDLSVPTVPQVMELAEAEGLVFEPGPPTLSDAAEANPDYYRHITLGGRVWWTPGPGTHGYEFITRVAHPPYKPRSEALRRAVQTRQSAEPEAGEDGKIR